VTGENVMEALAREIARVAALRERWRRLGEDNSKFTLATGQKLNVNVEPAIALMDRALDAAVAAAGMGDALECIRALQGLQGFRDE
jgi:hypothetical protein